MPIQYVVVCNEAVQVGSTLMCEMSDNSVRTYKVYMRLEQPQLNWAKNMTHDELVEFCRNYNTQAAANAGLNLHADKVRRLGWDYATRGY